MTSTKENPLGAAGLGNTSISNRSNYTKKFPPYGKQLDELRRNGLIPARRVIVTTDWNIGKLFPRIILPSDVPVTNIRFNYLTGLHVQIVHYDQDLHILEDLITEILSIRPASLSTFNMSAVKVGLPASKLVFSKSIMEKAA